MIYKIIDTAHELKKEFQEYNRDHYSLEGYQAMIEIFEDSDFEVDVIAICCDFTECTDEEFCSNYGLDEECTSYEIVRYLEANCGYYKMLDDNKIFYQNF